MVVPLVERVDATEQVWPLGSDVQVSLLLAGRSPQLEEGVAGQAQTGVSTALALPGVSGAVTARPPETAHSGGLTISSLTYTSFWVPTTWPAALV